MALAMAAVLGKFVLPNQFFTRIVRAASERERETGTKKKCFRNEKINGKSSDCLLILY